jgi:hypothetical protein
MYRFRRGVRGLLVAEPEGFEFVLLAQPRRDLAGLRVGPPERLGDVGLFHPAAVPLEEPDDLLFVAEQVVRRLRVVGVERAEVPPGGDEAAAERRHEGNGDDGQEYRRSGRAGAGTGAVVGRCEANPRLVGREPRRPVPDHRVRPGLARRRRRRGHLVAVGRFDHERRLVVQE